MPVFFNGRTFITPVTASAVDDTALANRNANVGSVLAILGTSEGGRPNTAIAFGNPIEARRVLASGLLADAIEKAFDPSAETPAPSRVIGIRINPATQSTLSLLNASATPAITLKSTDYGLRANQIRVRVESGTLNGKKLTTQFGSAIYQQDNIFRRAFSIQYDGAEATASITITNTTVTLEAPLSTVVATADLSAYATIRQLVDYLATIPGFSSATVLDSNDDVTALNGLDTINDADVKTAPYIVRADLQAAVDWFNGLAEGFVDAERVAGAGLPPANVPSTYFSGGSNGTVTSTQWSDALGALQAEDVQWVVPLTADSAIHAMVDAHCQFMSNLGRSERRAVVGGGNNVATTAAIAAASALASDRTSYVYPGHFDYNRAGQLQLSPAYMTAAIVGAAFAGAGPGEALTNKSLKVRGLEKLLRNPTDTDEIINGGVLAIERTPRGFRVVQSISTWRTNRNYNRVEQSCGAAVDFVVRTVRESLDVLRGQRGNPQNLARAVSIADTALRGLALPAPNGPGVIVGDDDNPPFKEIQASLEGDVLRVTFQASPVIPINYVLVTVFAVPFTASISG